MGLFNKLLDGLGVDPKKVEKVMGDIVDGAKNAVTEVKNAVSDASSGEQENRAAYSGGTDSGYSCSGGSESGDSWGEEMPAEPNQYNFNGNYIQYFENIFGTEFRAFRYDREDVRGTRRTVYTFYSAVQTKVLILELMPESASSGRIRKAAAAEGVPYLRFYFNHHGWWNTRSYVVRRMTDAINGR